MEMFAIISRKHAKGGRTQPRCLFEHRVEHRRQIAGRSIDDLQYFGGCGLLLQSFARLGQQPSIFLRNDRLRREVLQ